MRRRWDDVLGEVLVALAVVTQRAAAGRRAVVRWRRLRDGALRAAHGRGVTVDVLAARLRLSRSTVHKALRGARSGAEGAGGAAAGS